MENNSEFQKYQKLKDLRPFSILTVISKVIERVVERKLRLYIENNAVLPVYQTGFSSWHGAATALSHVIDNILSESYVNNSSIFLLSSSIILAGDLLNVSKRCKVHLYADDT